MLPPILPMAVVLCCGACAACSTPSDTSLVSASRPATTRAVDEPSSRLDIQQERQLLRGAAKAVAISLRSPQNRRRLANLMAESQDADWSVDLFQYLAAADLFIGSAGAAELSSMADFALTMPVLERRANWVSHDDLGVVAMLFDGDSLIGYNLDGSPLRGLNYDGPPAVPVIVMSRRQAGAYPDGPGLTVVPFQQCQPENGCDGGGGGGTAGGGGGGGTGGGDPLLRLASIEITDDNESWTAGHPEFEIWAMAVDSLGEPLLRWRDTGFPEYLTVHEAVAGSCISEAWPSGSTKYWNLDAINTLTNYGSTGPIVFIDTNPPALAQFSWAVWVTENDDIYPCSSANALEVPSIGDVGGFLSNDDDPVGLFTMENPINAMSRANVMDVRSISLTYAP